MRSSIRRHLARPNRGPLKAKPSYIEPQHFAGALIDLMEKLPATRTETQTQIQAAILHIPNTQLQQTLQFLYTRANGDITTFQNEIATWFDSSMSRVSGLYKRWMQTLLLFGRFGGSRRAERQYASCRPSALGSARDCAEIAAERGD